MSIKNTPPDKLPANPRVPLRFMFEKYYAPIKLATDGGNRRKQFLGAIGRFEKFLGHEATIRDGKDDVRAEFATWLDEKYATGTAGRSKVCLLQLCKFAWRIGLMRKRPSGGQAFDDEWRRAKEAAEPITTLRQLVVKREETWPARYAVNALHRFLKREPIPADLETATGFDAWLQETTLHAGSKQRIQSGFRSLVRLWKAEHAEQSPALAPLVKDYAQGRDIRQQSLKPLRVAVAAFTKHLGHDASIADLHHRVVNDWLAVEVERVKRRTARNHRAAVVMLWRWLFIEGKTDEAPLRVRLIKAPLAPPAAYTMEEVKRLLAACESLEDKFCRMKVKRSRLYAALILVAWDSGLRLGDLLRIKWENLSGDGCLQVVQGKTRTPLTCWLNTATLAAVERIRVEGVDTVFGEHTTAETIRMVFRKLSKAADIKRGSLKWIRRATGTTIAIQHGDEAGRMQRGRSDLRGSIFTKGTRMRAWIFQDRKQKSKLGDKCPWSVGWYDPDGKRREKRIGSKSLAEKFARKTEGQLAAGTYEGTGKKKWSEFIAEYRERGQPGATDGTRDVTSRAIAHFERIIKPIYVASIKTKTFALFVATRKAELGAKEGETVSPATINKELRHLRAIVRKANRWGYLPAVPAIDFLREPGKLAVYVTPEHFAKLYEHCDAPRWPADQAFEPADWWRALLIMAYMTGWRIGSLLALRREDVDLDGGFALSRAEDNKGKRDQRIPLHPLAIEHLRRIVNFSPLVFDWEHGRRAPFDEFWAIQAAAGQARGASSVMASTTSGGPSPR